MTSTTEQIIVPPPGTLLFEGGGNRGTAYIGVVDALRQLELLGRVRTVAGSSIGAFISLVFTLSGGEVGNSCLVETLRSFQDVLSLRGSARLLDPSFSTLELVSGTGGPDDDDDEVANDGDHVALGARTPLGFFSGIPLWEAVRGLLRRCGASGSITFRDLHALTGYTLVVTAYDLRAQKLVYCSHLDTPGMEVAAAVVGSMSVPVLFPPVAVLAGDRWMMLVDGGLLANAPWLPPEPHGTAWTDDFLAFMIGTQRENAEPDVVGTPRNVVDMVRVVFDVLLTNAQLEIPTEIESRAGVVGRRVFYLDTEAAIQRAGHDADPKKGMLSPLTLAEMRNLVMAGGRAVCERFGGPARRRYTPSAGVRDLFVRIPSSVTVRRNRARFILLFVSCGLLGLLVVVIFLRHRWSGQRQRQRQRAA